MPTIIETFNMTKVSMVLCLISQTRLIGDYTEDATTFDVDSTVGFPKSMKNVTYADRTNGIVSYTSNH